MSLDRWHSLMAAMKLPTSEDCYQSLITAYGEAHRHYHTFEHITAMLKHFDKCNDQGDNPQEIEIAIWFHDAIYKPFSSSNELDSANWAQRFLLEAGYDEDKIKRVFELIMATQHHGLPKSTDEKLLVDIDLSILGSSAKRYDQFEKQVRQEYKWVPGLIYRKKRKALLESFLNRPSIYSTDHFRKQFESQARINIQEALSSL